MKQLIKVYLKKVITEISLITFTVLILYFLDKYIFSDLMSIGNVSPTLETPFFSVTLLLAVLIIFQAISHILYYKARIWAIILWVASLVLLVDLLVFRPGPQAEGIELNPFAFIQDFFNDNTSIYITIINFVLFLLIAFTGCLAMGKWSLYKVIAFSAGLGLAIEVIQLLTARGLFSLADFLLYTLGAFCGGFIFVVARPIFQRLKIVESIR